MQVMRSSELNDFLSSSSNGKKLKSAIKSELPEFQRGKSEKGRSAPVYIKNEGNNFVLTKSGLINLCNWYLNNEINEIELEYVASILELSSDFEYETSIADELFLLSAPEINGPLNQGLVKNILDRLNSNA